MIILGIDPGYERLGIAILNKEPTGREVLIYSECFRTSAQQSFPERLHAVGNELVRIITEFKPDHLAIEELYFAKNTKTAMKVAEVRGAIITICAMQGLAVFEYHPNAIKLAVAGYGGATKSDVAVMIPRLITIPPGIKKIDDELDAIAVGLTHSASYRVM